MNRDAKIILLPESICKSSKLVFLHKLKSTELLLTDDQEEHLHLGSHRELLVAWRPPPASLTCGPDRTYLQLHKSSENNLILTYEYPKNAS